LQGFIAENTSCPANGIEEKRKDREMFREAMRLLDEENGHTAFSNGAPSGGT